MYRNYPYKRPLPINPPPSSQPLQSSYFGVLHPPQHPPALRFRKKRRFSTSPIEYRLCILMRDLLFLENIFFQEEKVSRENAAYEK